MLVKEIFCACGCVSKLVLWGGGAWLCFLVFEGFSMFHVKHDVFTTTHLFHVKHCFCFTTSQGCQCVSRETQGGVVKLLVMVFENSFSCRC